MFYFEAHVSLKFFARLKFLLLRGEHASYCVAIQHAWQHTPYNMLLKVGRLYTAAAIDNGIVPSSIDSRNHII